MFAQAVSRCCKLLSVMMALVLALSMAPAAWADDASSPLPASSVVADVQEDAEAAPTADAQSASGYAASSGSAGGTTVKIEVYRSSFPIVAWSLNDDDHNLTKATWSWADRTSELPQDGTPGQTVEWSAPSGYEEPTRDGFEFAGWSTNPSAPAGGFLKGEPTITMPEGAPEGGEYTLYALWTPLEYAVVFELAKNPDVGEGPGSEGSFALNWSTQDGVRTVTDLGNGRYQVSGFTMKESGYDPVTRTVTLPEPARTGYRFLGWAEAADASGLVVDGPGGMFELNPVRLPQIDGTPVLTARWTSAFGVTAPLSITFGDYDKIGAPDNPSMGEEDVRVADDTVQSEADDTATPGLTDQERYERLGQAYFENTGWNDPIRMVAITSERTSNANEVLTTYDSKKATEAAVLGDGTVTNPGERLLSLYPSATEPSDKATGVHFRLTDNLIEEDLSVLPSLAPGEQQPVTYGLNLANDPVTGGENHGLVLDTDDYEPKQIATVSYTFAVADAAAEEPVSDCLFIVDGSNTYKLDYIKRAAEDLSANGIASKYYAQFKGYLDAQKTSNGAPGAGPYFKVRINGVYWDLQLIGICQDTKTAGGNAGLTFQTRDVLSYSNTICYPGSGSYDSYMNSTNTNSGGWASSKQRNNLLRTTFYDYLDERLQEAIARVNKYQQLSSGTTSAYLQKSTNETVWLPSLYEVFGMAFANCNEAEGLSVNGNVPFQYMAYQGNSGSQTNIYALKKRYTGSGTATSASWWLRSAYRNSTLYFCTTNINGASTNAGGAAEALGIAPAFCL